MYMALNQPVFADKRSRKGDSVFAEVPFGVRGHFRLHFYAALFHVVYYLYKVQGGERDALATTLANFPFLKKYMGEMRGYLPEKSNWAQSLAWWRRQLCAWEAGGEKELPLCRTPLEAHERIGLLLVGLVEEDARFGTLFAAVQQPRGSRRPSFGLVDRIMREAADILGDHASSGSVGRALLRQGLVEAVDREVPRSEWELRIPAPIWDVLQGEEPGEAEQGYRLYTRENLPSMKEMVLSAAVGEQLANVPALLREGEADTFVVRGTPGAQRLEAVGCVARALGLGLLTIADSAAREGSSMPWLGAVATLAESLPVFCPDVSPGESYRIPRLCGYQGPVAVVVGLQGGVIADSPMSGVPSSTGARSSRPENAGVVALRLPLPNAEEREAHWRQALAGYDVEDLQAISERFHLAGGYIRRAGALAAARAGMDRRRTITAADVQAAVRMLGREALDTLATHLETEGSWNDLIASEGVTSRLREVEGRCRHRERLYTHLGPAFKTQRNRGVRALFSGPSGTGKTLAAKILAAELGKDLYRIDLAAVVNKYIGETEKSLHRALTTAEETDVIVLLDEGDSLLAKRSEVSSANDRYANLETNFLLQRLETYQGIVFITTNAADAIDPAFQRRMDVVVQFFLPQAQERLAIWDLHLPTQNALKQTFLEEVALRCELSGGQIRSAAMQAALLALEDGGQMHRSHLIAAIQSEYRKAGALCPLSERDESRSAPTGVDTFLTAISGDRARRRRHE